MRNILIFSFDITWLIYIIIEINQNFLPEEMVFRDDLALAQGCELKFIKILEEFNCFVLDLEIIKNDKSTKNGELSNIYYVILPDKSLIFKSFLCFPNFHI